VRSERSFLFLIILFLSPQWPDPMGHGRHYNTIARPCLLFLGRVRCRLRADRTGLFFCCLGGPGMIRAEPPPGLLEPTT
jgi:hypothetical protein